MDVNIYETLGKTSLTPEELAKAREWCERNNGVTDPTTGEEFIFSSIPKVQAFQVGCIAMSWRAKSRQDEFISHRDPNELQARIEAQRKGSASFAIGKYRHIALDDPTNWKTPALGFMKDQWPKMGKSLLLLSGPTGTSKTFSAVAYMGSQVECSFVLSREVWNGMMVTSKDISLHLGVGDGNRDFAYNLKHKRHLIIDDLKFGGQGTVTAAFIETIDDVINHREACGLPTYITTNGTPKQIAETYGDRFVSRFEGSGFIFITKGEDLRRPKT